MKKGKPVRKNKSQFVNISIKSSFIILFGILLSTLGVPVLLDSLGLTLYPLRVLAIALMTGFIFSYCVYFVDSKRGFTKGFWTLFVLISLLAGLIAYFWVYNIYFI